MNITKLIVCYLVLTLSVYVAHGVLFPEDNDGEDYYWQAYTGTIPKDALPGGTDFNGKSTYIGNAFYDSETLVPGEIDATKKTLFYAMDGQQQTATTNVKILCARNPQYYEWITTNISHSRHLAQKHLIPGGIWGKYLHLIGSVGYDKKQIVGKIVTTPGEEEFAFISSGKAYYIDSDFQILTYNDKLVTNTHNNISKSGCSYGTYNYYNSNVYMYY